MTENTQDQLLLCGCDVMFQAPELYGMREIERLELWREGDTSLEADMAAADFYCELIVINNRSTEKWFYFPVLRWLAPDSSTRLLFF